MADSPVPDDKQPFLALRKLGLEDEVAYTFVQNLRDMAAANLIARFEAKLDALNARLDAKLDALNAQLGAQNARLDAQNLALQARLDAQNAGLVTLRWLIGVGFVLLGVLMTAFRLFA